MNYIETIQYVNESSTFSILKNGDLNVEHAGITFKNFSGNPTWVNPAGGKRTFSLVLTEELADQLNGMGWNIKVKEVRDHALAEGEKTLTVNYEDWLNLYRQQFDNSMLYTEVVVNDQSDYPPRIYKVSEFNGEKSMVLIPPEQWSRLDKDDLENIDLVIHPYVHGRSVKNPDAKKGYLKSMYAVAHAANPIDEKYAGYMVNG